MITKRAFKLTILLAIAHGFAGFVAVARKSDYVRGCYFTIRSHHRNGYGSFTVKDIAAELCTHIMAAFVNINLFGKTIPYESGDISLFKQLTGLKKSDPKLKILLSYGGPEFGSKPFTEIARSAEKRKQFIESAIAFIRKHNFDGLDLDWEYPMSVPDDYKKLSDELYEAFVDEASKSRKPQLLLTAAVSAAHDKILMSYDIPAMARSFDLVFLMSYDLHGPWEPTTDLHAKLREESGDGIYNTEIAAEVWVAGGIPEKKLIIGIPSYSRGYTLKSSSSADLGAPSKGPSSPTATYPDGGAAYWEICEMIKSNGKEHVKTKSVGAFMVKGDQWHGYDNPETVHLKMKWLKKKGYGGAFLWSLDTDDFAGMKCNNVTYPLLRAINSGLGVTTPKPKPKPTTRKPRRKKTKATTRKKHKPTTKEAPEPETTTLRWKGIDCKKDPNGYFRDPTDCQKFYQCDHGYPVLKSCGPGTYFNEDFLGCDFRYKAPPGVCN